MKFRYSARTKIGELQVGFIEAANREMAADTLTSHELFVLSLEPAERPRWISSIVNIFEKAKRVDLMVFTRQFATMLEAKIPLNDCLKTLYRQTRSPLLKEAIFELASDIDAGLSLSQSLERHPAVFSEFYVNLVRSAEITGRIEEILNYLADYLEKEQILISKIRNAFIYPAFIVVVFFLVAGILVGVVFPQLEPIFTEVNMQLPLITRILLGAGVFAARWWWTILIALGIFIFIVVDYFRTEEGRVVWDQIKINLLFFKRLYRKIYVARFAEGVSVLIKGGIPIVQAIEISSHVIGSVTYRDILHEIAEGVRRGELFSQMLERNEAYFPSMVSQMVAIGETTGKLDEMLSRVSVFFMREINDLVNNLVEFIQPALMVIIGVMVGLLFASILLPIYNMAQLF